MPSTIRSQLALLLALFSGAVTAAPGKEVVVNVQGMVCAFCSQGITKKFKAEEAVDSVTVDMDKKQVRLLFKEGKNLDDARITDLIKDAGVNVERIAR